MLRSLSSAFLAFWLHLLITTHAHADIVWHWESQFNHAEQDKLKSRITTTVAAVESAVGQYPFDVHIYFHRLEGRGEPVPWANTHRNHEEAIHFHVDPNYSESQLLADWTAPHELSHLLFPYVGRRYSWFAEGFASFMQYQIMYELGVMTKAQLQPKYHAKINRAKDQFSTLNLEIPFHSAAERLRQSRLYPVYYWGGAVYFLNVNKMLSKQDSNLSQVVANYLACCRIRAKGLDDLIEDLDDLSSSHIFSAELKKMKRVNGFPVAR